MGFKIKSIILYLSKIFVIVKSVHIFVKSNERLKNIPYFCIIMYTLSDFYCFLFL